MDTPVSSLPQSYAWHEVWRQVIFHPSTDTFQRILADPKAKPSRAFIWVALATVFPALIQTAVSAAIGVSALEVKFNAVREVFISITCVPIGAVIGLAISAGIYRLVAGWMGGKGSYDDMVYALGAVEAPYALVYYLYAALMTPQVLKVFALNSQDPNLALRQMGYITAIPIVLSIYSIILSVLAW